MGLGSSIKKELKRTEDKAKKAVGVGIDVATLGLSSGATAGLKGKGGSTPATLAVEQLETARTKAGLASTILTGALGVEEDESQLRRKTLLGSKSNLGKA